MCSHDRVFVCRMSTFSKIFSETAWPIKLKFYVKPPWVGERKFVHGILDLDPRSFKSILCFLFVRYHVADQVDILCGVFLGSGIDILFTISWSHDQDGRHTQIW